MLHNRRVTYPLHIITHGKLPTTTQHTALHDFLRDNRALSRHTSLMTLTALSHVPKPVVLAILDGWGHRDAHDHNAIAAARTPTWDMLLRDFPNGLINASELEVGLPEGQMGNSEVGHMNIGSGRIVMQDLPRIDRAIIDGTLAGNAALNDFINKLKSTGGDCHLLGLLSPGGVHSHQRHIAALARIIAGAGVRVQVHAFLDGRDTPPQSALGYLAEFYQDIAGITGISIATISGRYYAMDRDKRWDRVEKAYKALAHAQGIAAPTAQDAVQASYDDGKTDEFILPAIIGDYAGMKSGDGIFMGNFRADRAREILTALLDPAFSGFERSAPPAISAALGLVEYSTALNSFLATAFPPEELTNILGEVISHAGLKQLRIAETEKYAHVTFFFNGGKELEFPGEERILIPSPDVPTYDLKPEMSAFEITDKLVEAISSNRFDLIIVNYANTDMVGHTGDLQAATLAVEAVDKCLGSVWAAVEKAGGALIVTADHGNAETMHDHDTAQPHTAHTINLVPLVLAHSQWKGQRYTATDGKLADIAPTILEMLRLEKPAEMTGQSLASTL